MSNQTIDAKRMLTRALPLAALASAGLNLVLYGLVTKVFGLSPALAPEPDVPLEPLSAGAVIGASVVPAVAATLLLLVLARFLRRPVLVFLIVSAVFLLVSMGGPVSAQVDADSTRWVLAAMHIVAGVSIVGVLAKLGATTRQP